MSCKYTNAGSTPATSTKIINMETKEQFQVFDDYTAEVNGTYKIGDLTGLYYKDLVSKLGPPTVIGSGDDKVQYEWIVEYEDRIYTIYDWKTYDAHYTEYELTNWSIGGNAKSTLLLDDFKKLIYNLEVDTNNN